MAENQPPAMPQPPQGMQRPGIAGAGNILDPAVRGQIREVLHPAVHQAGQLARGGKGQEDGGEGGGNVASDAEPSADQAAKPTAPEAGAPQPAPRRLAAGYRAGPFPHGDLDLSYIAANVPNEPARPRRQRGGRRFYFLPEAPVGDQAAKPRYPPGPQPG